MPPTDTSLPENTEPLNNTGSFTSIPVVLGHTNSLPLIEVTVTSKLVGLQPKEYTCGSLGIDVY